MMDEKKKISRCLYLKTVLMTLISAYVDPNFRKTQHSKQSTLANQRTPCRLGLTGQFTLDCTAEGFFITEFMDIFKILYGAYPCFISK